MDSVKYSLKKLLTKRNALFTIGILFGFVGFLLAHEQTIPFVSQAFYRNVNALRAGFNDLCGLPVDVQVEDVSERYRRLKSGDGELSPRELGFKELSGFIVRDLRGRRSEYFAKTWSGTRSYEGFRKMALRGGFSKMKYQGILETSLICTRRLVTIELTRT